MRYRRRYQADYASDLLEKRFIPKNVAADATPDVRISLEDMYQYVSSLQEAVEMWYKMCNPLASDLSPDTQMWLDKLNRIGMDQFQPLVLVFLQCVSAESKRIAFLQAVERYLFIYSLYYYGYRYPYFLDGSKTLQLAIDLDNNKLTGEKVTRAISDITSASLKHPHFIKELRDRFKSESFYDWTGIRYFLFEYNLDLQSRSKTERRKIFWPEFTEQKIDFVSVEHIYPQQARHPYWKTHFDGLAQKQRTALRNSLGNLLPLSKPKNSSLSNKPFPEKVGKGDSVVGYRYGCYAENEVAKVTDWTPEEILKRGLKVLSFMEKRWELELGDDKSKKIMLGLDFLT